MIFSLICFFFFKQKTAYELRISDWSSDVCSSDLAGHQRDRRPVDRAFVGGGAGAAGVRNPKRTGGNARHHRGGGRNGRGRRRGRLRPRPFRSEEHTSELQSLMRISYADFCLKQKTNTM